MIIINIVNIEIFYKDQIQFYFRIEIFHTTNKI